MLEASVRLELFETRGLRADHAVNHATLIGGRLLPVRRRAVNQGHG
jgi:hypothetical protein